MERSSISYHKVLLPNYDVFDEARYFAPAAKPAPPFSYQGLKIGITLCEDIWNAQGLFPNRLYEKDPVLEIAKGKPDVILNLSASPFHAAKLPLRQALLKEVTQKTGAPVLYCNLVGGNDELVFDGCSMAMDGGGNLFQVGKAFEEDFFVFDTENPSAKNLPPAITETGWIYQALVTGTRDYVRKCGFEKVLVGLSGGIDSALVACHRLRGFGAGKRHGSHHALPLFFQRFHRGLAPVGGRVGHRVQGNPHYPPIPGGSLQTLTPVL